MYSSYTIHRILSLWTAIMLLTVAHMFTACKMSDAEDCPDDGGQQADVRQYINLSVTVSGGHTATRAGEQPAAGENGDGREAGLERENTVSGITVLFYQDDKGINTTENPTVDFVAYYETTLVSRETAGSNYTDKIDEAVYTTGDRLVSGTTFDPENTYHAIVVANKDLTKKITAGTSKLNDVRNMVMRENIYSGEDVTKATNFIMSSEADCEISPANATVDNTVPQKIVYKYKDIRIERLAARIDFWAVNGTYNADKKGYEYTVYDGDNATDDRFVVTGIMPFNLNHYDTNNGGEYLLKRLTDNIEENFAVSWLADETGSNYVVDPATTTKGGGELTYFQNKLLDIKPAETAAIYIKPFYRTAADLYAALTSNGGIASFEDNGKKGDNLIIAYSFENTLWDASLLYNYATGLAIEGDYYVGGTGEPQHRIYYGYLRHNGSSASAYHAMLGAELVATEKATSANAMEFGIVRNNIYRVYISKINKEVTGSSSITLNIKVKKWDVFTHKTIYM